MPEYDCKVPDITPKEGYGLIYLYTMDDGTQYVGQTACPLIKRHYGHMVKELYIDHKIRTHKWVLKVLGEYPEEKLDEMEKLFIKQYNTLYPNGLNLEEGGSVNRHPCEETRRKMSESWDWSKHFTPEICKKISDAGKGRRLTEYQKKKLMEAHIGKPSPLKGTKFTEDHKQKISQSQKGRVISEDSRKKYPNRSRATYHGIRAKKEHK